MANPQFTAGTVGALIAQRRLAASANIAGYLDLSTRIEGQVTCRVSTSGTVTANSYTKNEAYYVYGATQLNGAVSAAARDLVVDASTGLASGMKIVVDNELRTVLGVAGLNVQIDALAYAHSDDAAVYLVEKDPTHPGVNALGGSVNTSFSRTSYLPTGKWCYVLTNLDATNAVVVEATASTIDAFS